MSALTAGRVNDGMRGYVVPLSITFVAMFRPNECHRPSIQGGRKCESRTSGNPAAIGSGPGHCSLAAWKAKPKRLTKSDDVGLVSVKSDQPGCLDGLARNVAGEQGCQRRHVRDHDDLACYWPDCMALGNRPVGAWVKACPENRADRTDENSGRSDSRRLRDRSRTDARPRPCYERRRGPLAS